MQTEFPSSSPFSQVAWRKSDKQPVDVPWMAITNESEQVENAFIAIYWL
jgi:hypothetical protein